MKSGAIIYSLVVTTLAAFATAGICGTGDEDDAYVAGAPDGKSTIIRIQPVKDTVACGESALIEVWLDNLKSGPPPGPTGQPHGGAGVNYFQFSMKYDPDVLGVTDAEYVTIDAALDEAGPAGDIARGFESTVHEVDDSLGVVRVFVESALIEHLPPHVAAAADTIPAGIDPVVVGEPIRLVTLNMTAWGAGSTTLTLDEAGDKAWRVLLINDSGATYSISTSLESAVEVTGDCTAPARVDPTNVPTPPKPTPTPGGPPIETPLPQSPPYPLPTAVAGCSWQVTKEAQGFSADYVHLISDCYDGLYYFNTSTGEFGRSRVETDAE